MLFLIAFVKENNLAVPESFPTSNRNLLHKVQVCLFTIQCMLNSLREEGSFTKSRFSSTIKEIESKLEFPKLVYY
jgi:hypothetical protein